VKVAAAATVGTVVVATVAVAVWAKWVATSVVGWASREAAARARGAAVDAE
jgi:hypothetical protein